MERMGVVVQCFVKRDTLEGALESLLRCSGVDCVNLLLWSDSPNGSRSPERYSRLSAGVEAYLDAFVAQYGHRFASVERGTNLVNLGTCKTCEVAMNHAFSRDGFVIFAEDDVIFSRDALQWFDALRRQGVLAADKVWAIAGESVFFNARNDELPCGWVDRMLKLTVEESLISYYVENRFVPSTCFATERSKWLQFGPTRGQPLGDVDLCMRCEAEDRYAIFPIVPRVKDVGMLHDDGYSVLIHGKDGVREIKRTYLMSDDVSLISDRAPEIFFAYTGDAGRIYTESTLLKRV